MPLREATRGRHPSSPRSPPARTGRSGRGAADGNQEGRVPPIRGRGCCGSAARLRGTRRRYTDVLAFASVQVPISARWEGHHEVAAGRARTQIARNRLAETRQPHRARDREAMGRARHGVARGGPQRGGRGPGRGEPACEERDRYEAGSHDLSDLLEAEVLVQKARDRRIEARREFWLARSAYLRAVGQDDSA